jgi:hypothetical protein
MAQPEDRIDFDGPTTAVMLAYLLDQTDLLNHLDSTERGVVRRAIELLGCLPIEGPERIRPTPIM